MFAFGLAPLLIFLVMAAQFESFKDPFVIMFTVPLPFFGALLFMWARGVTMNIYSQIGIIMLSRPRHQERDFDRGVRQPATKRGIGRYQAIVGHAAGCAPS